MGQTRKIWQDVNAKVKAKGFEATLHLKEDLGTDLDLLDSL